MGLIDLLLLVFARLTINGIVSVVRLLSHYVRYRHYGVGKHWKLCGLINYSSLLSTPCQVHYDDRTSSKYMHPRMELSEVWSSPEIF